MEKVQSSFTFLFLFLMEWPLLVCLPYAGDRKDDTPEPTKNNIRAHSMAPNTNTWDAVMIPCRPALVQVITIACIVLSIALVCGAAVSYIIYRLVQTEKRQQLALLYKNIKIPLLGDEEKDSGQEESGYVLAENEKNLAKFINSVIIWKSRQHFERTRLKSEQQLVNIWELYYPDRCQTLAATPTSEGSENLPELHNVGGRAGGTSGLLFVAGNLTSLRIDSLHRMLLSPAWAPESQWS
ncbi:uncharacterized protein C19orf18 homolog [Phyllostomus hastatus]|uniref:uncharacterized protein C19orf18 homolog n=1 Tax=Phyllostomus hastatus TaxID=9423 RepID=UPI001E685357|nr:uncharacterized protein C19orf18 homolog [Phyllostomus hastatus]